MFGRSKFKEAFVVVNFPESAQLIYNSTYKLELLEPGEKGKETITVQIAPVTLEYVYSKMVHGGDETLIFLNRKKIIFNYSFLRDLKILEMEKI